MAFKIQTTAGNTEEVDVLRQQITEALTKHNAIEVYLLQPGIMYTKKTNDPNITFISTVIDFIKEWNGMPVSFFSNLIPLRETTVPFTYTNDMFFAGYQLYKKNERCKSLLSLLDTINPDRPYHWDLLLGEQRDTKDLLHNMVQSHPVRSKVFLTYYGKDSSRGYWSRYVVRPREHTAETLLGPKDRVNSQIRCSDLIDPEIYNQTYYTAIIETTIHEDFAMFSEKEAKPIVAKRPFVIFGSPGHLRAFRQLGFKSFAPVIDESYDDESDMFRRFSMCLDAMNNLSEKNPVEVYKFLKDVLEHNKKHFEEHSWSRCINFDKDL